jgi:dihydrofolate reductase
MMRELILKMSISVDGFVGAVDGGIGWGRARVAELISNASLHIMGSRTFRDVTSWWPTSTDIFGPPMNLIPKAVFTRQAPGAFKMV